MVVIRPDAYRRLLEASDFMTKSPIATYIKELQQRIPEVINSTKLSSQEKMTQYGRLIKKLNDLAEAPFEGDLRALAIETNTQATPGTQTVVQPRIVEPIEEIVEAPVLNAPVSQQTIETQTTEQYPVKMIQPKGQVAETQTKIVQMEPMETQTQHFSPVAPIQPKVVEEESPLVYFSPEKPSVEETMEPAPKKLFSSPKLKIPSTSGAVGGKQWIQSPNLTRPKRNVKQTEFYKPY